MARGTRADVAVNDFDAFTVGDTLVSNLRTVGEDDVERIVAIGGYTHPLFRDPAYAAASPFGKRPMPGQGVLVLMGGLAEATGAFGPSTIGLVGLDDVRFRAPVFAGDVVRLEIDVLSKTPRGARGEIAMRWRCVGDDDVVRVEATARMLFALPSDVP